MIILLLLLCLASDTVKSVYKGPSREPENVAFMSSCPLYSGLNYMLHSSMPFIDSDLLYRGQWT
jgi:hypothetical protein